MTAILTETTRHLTTQLGEELKRPQGNWQRRPALRQFVRSTDMLAEITLSTWAWICETLEDGGFEGREFAGYCRVLLEAIDGALSGYERLLALAAEAKLTAEAAGLPDLDVKLIALREVRPRIAEAFSFATQPPRPIDEKRLAESIAALERGEMIDCDDEFIDRFVAGGNI
ncbi:MAG TPA: hypothetical protein DDY78_07795 [Planctomycetales bacterium]|jgi:hypothetical protein|nr:hypothetical protein [Planctomycetales bacterium]